MFKLGFIDTPAGRAQLKRSRRKTLAISVLPNGALELVAPENAAIEAILARIEKRLPWIRKQQRAFMAMNARRAPRRYVSGATHKYLGRQYRLKVFKGKELCVKLVGGYFHVFTGNGSEHEVKRLLTEWMRERARGQFISRLRQWQDWCLRHSLPEPRLALRAMPKRWGSAHKDGRITLNPDLVRAPSVCIDYVIAHEICHLRHPNHGPKFFGLLQKIYPNWRTVKNRLEQADF